MSTLAAGDSIGLEDVDRARNWLNANDDIAPSCDIRDKVFAIEREMLKLPQRELSIRYYHGGGVFTGELFIPKGTVLVGKIHKYENLNVMTKGKLSVLVGNEIKKVYAPYVVVSPPGTKRIAYAHEDTIWMTFHKTEEVVKEEVEKIFIAQSEQEWLEFCNSQPLLPF